MYPPPAAATEVAAELAAVRPGLVAGFSAELPGARAAVLTRLWRALAHEPLPWVESRDRSADGVTLRLRDGRRLHGPASDPYATGAHAPAVDLDGRPYDDPARLLAALAVPHGDGFAAELSHSAASLALSRAAQRELPDETPTRDREWEWEQRVVDGHPYHPNCRARPGFSVAEQLAYAPEHRPLVRLGLVPVPADRALVSGDWPDTLRAGSRLLVPVHPWQAAHVLKRRHDERHRHHDERHRNHGEERNANEERERYDEARGAHPLMSLRTLALPAGPHVKTALSARLTSSVRDISVPSVTSSAMLSAFAERLAARTDGLLHITRTLGAVTDGTPELAAVLRESPEEYAGPGERVVPVAALPLTGLPGSAAWLAEFARLVLAVGLRLLELGVALEAHGQNLLVVLSPADAPVRLVYRDLADIRVSPARLTGHGIEVPALPARILTDDQDTLRRKLFGSLIAGTLAATAGSGPALGAVLETALADLPRTPDTLALREGPVPAKALTLMRLTPDRKGDLWAELPNPLQ
ncbi:IucA/IucC family protein [Streptomyces sp. NPDC004610]|uniref:IucA/IucC family protein n=1 Tax=unclassified Streptomyces TaxID=2593676 RepID=UPI0033A60E28